MLSHTDYNNRSLSLAKRNTFNCFDLQFCSHIVVTPVVLAKYSTNYSHCVPMGKISELTFKSLNTQLWPYPSTALRFASPDRLVLSLQVYGRWTSRSYSQSPPQPPSNPISQICFIVSKTTWERNVMCSPAAEERIELGGWNKNSKIIIADVMERITGKMRKEKTHQPCGRSAACGWRAVGMCTSLHKSWEIMSACLLKTHPHTRSNITKKKVGVWIISQHPQ